MIETKKRNKVMENADAQDTQPTNPKVFQLGISSKDLFPDRDSRCHVLSHGLKPKSVIILGDATDGKRWIISKRKLHAREKIEWDDVDVYNLDNIQTATHMGICNQVDCDCVESLIESQIDGLQLEKLYDNQGEFAGFYIP